MNLNHICTKDLNVSDETIEKSPNFEPESGMNPIEIQTRYIGTYLLYRKERHSSLIHYATLVIDCLK